jgi:predicted RNA-binding protein Jag
MISENIHKFCEENDIHIMEYLLSIVKLLDWDVIFSNDDNWNHSNTNISKKCLKFLKRGKQK